MAATKRAYRSLGYEVVCRIPDFYAPSDDKLILQKRPTQSRQETR